MIRTGNPPAMRRGQPLLVFGIVLIGWIGARAALWEDLPNSTTLSVPTVMPHGPSSPQSLPVAALPPPSSTWPPLVQSTGAQVRPHPVPSLSIMHPRKPVQVQTASPPPVFAPGIGSGQSAMQPRVSGGHQIAWIAGLAQLPAPSFIQQRSGPIEPRFNLPPALPSQRLAAAPRVNRWSVDGWLLLRQGGVGAAESGLPPASYGASQAGAVVRYRLSPSDPRRPALYLRATSAVTAPRGEEAAIGLMLRPTPRIPVVLAGEVRATQLGSSVALRPSVSLVTELDRISLPLSTRAELYAQAGYVGGRGTTPFIDAQVRIDHKVTTIGPVELRAGAGAWGGAQQGASRLDVGPTATVDFPLAGGRGRIAADWRLRVSGNAAPQSGPAITLSAGF